MKIQELQQLYAVSPQVKALAKVLEEKSGGPIFLEGLIASGTAMYFAALSAEHFKLNTPLFLFIMQDAEAAGYLYHDLQQMLGDRQVLFFPSAYRRSAKYGQRDAANEILRTEVLAKLTSYLSPLTSHLLPLYIVTFPDAVDEPVVSREQLSDHTLTLRQGQSVEVEDIARRLRELGFSVVDYVYEPGQFALRGSILDVFSFSSEYPFRVDFFGDDIDTIRTFEVENQLSRDKREQITIVPELTDEEPNLVSFFSFLPKDAMLVTRDYDAPESKDFRRVLLRLPHNASPHLSVHLTPQPLFHKNFELLKQSLGDYVSRGYHIYILADSQKQNERLKEILGSEGVFTPVDKTLHEGFADNDLKLCVFTDHQIFDRFHKYNLKSDRARSGKVALTLKEIQQFEVGDYIVHIDHGIGKFGGLVRMPQGDGYQEMIKIIYQGGGAIYVSIHSLYKVSKYKSQENGEPPRLSHLGTGQWERMKERTKQKLKDIARDLIQLYAARRKEKGFAYSPDSSLQHELEASFLYEDTPDQLKATNDVKADMERPRPMDRLVCGDVGFGKTEVAVRAAFKAACDSKQTAVLVPTTVLAYQHYQTFSSRLKDMPVRVEYLSRARSAKQTKEILADLASGRIDILIGTHKLISKTVKFHDLGLLIIDEEQKFGVSTKEKLRQLKTSVDTLTMSATPIPRTLQFSLVGARDLSTIQTPPPNRYPIQTEIHTFSPDIIAEAINFEMSRNGQVFFVNNRISDLQRLAEMIHKYVPDARVAIGHGQMKPDELEQVVFDFANYDYDVLLSTTIVENGIDIPNANTIIINGAHNFGLSDLHQMRGRVGRSNRKAFCYLLAPPLSALNVEARRRLEALENFSDLGSGISIAMQDLDIRGAGNLLGSEQSGFIADLGYETYLKILNEAVVEIHNESGDGQARKSRTSNLLPLTSDFVSDCTLESDLEMYFPDQYVPTDSERMLLYRELDNLMADDELERYRTRLVDRFGPLPPQAAELLLVVPLRRLGRQLGCEKMMLKQGRMTLFFVSNPDSPFYQSAAFDHILDFVAQNPRRCQLREQNSRRSLVIGDVPTVETAVSLLSSL